MNISDIRVEKREFECRLTNLISAELKEFAAKTGVCPSDISVCMAEHRQIGIPRGSIYLVTDVIARIEI